MKIPLKRDVPPRAVLAVIALVLLASVVAGSEIARSPAPAESQNETAPAPPRAAAPAPAPAPVTEADSDFAKQRATHAPKEKVTDLFATQEIARTPAETERPKAPAEPPLPFKYLGRIIEGERTTVFVGHNEESYALAPGDTVERLYRVERISPDAVIFRHLPTGKRQALALREPN